MDVALVEDAEHDVDDEDRDEKQEREVRERALKRLRCALELSGDALGQVRGSDVADAAQDVAKRRARRETERDRDGGQLAVVIHRLRADDLRRMRERVE